MDAVHEPLSRRRVLHDAARKWAPRRSAGSVADVHSEVSAIRPPFLSIYHAMLTVNRHYDIGYGLVSIIFLGNAIGFISAALFTNWLASNFRYARAFMVAEGLKLAAYAILATTPPVGLVMFA